MDPNYYEIGPGFAGFVVAFVMAVAVIIIYRSMSKHLRKVRMDEQQAARERGSGAEDGDRGGDVVADEASDGQ